MEKTNKILLNTFDLMIFKKENEIREIKKMKNDAFKTLTYLNIIMMALEYVILMAVFTAETIIFSFAYIQSGLNDILLIFIVFNIFVMGVLTYAYFKQFEFGGL